MGGCCLTGGFMLLGVVWYVRCVRMPTQTVYFGEDEYDAIEQSENSFSGAVRAAVKDYYGLEEA